MNQPEASPSNNADAGRRLSEGLGLMPERANLPPQVGRLLKPGQRFGQPVYSAEQMYAYAAQAVAAERERPRQVVAYMATNREGEMRFTDSPDAARELEGYGWAITPLADAGPN